MNVEVLGFVSYSTELFLLGTFPNRARWIFLGGGISACALAGLGLNGEIIWRGLLLFIGAFICVAFYSAYKAPRGDWENLYVKWSFCEDLSRWVLLLQGCFSLIAGGNWMLWAPIPFTFLLISLLIRRC